MELYAPLLASHSSSSSSSSSSSESNSESNGGGGVAGSAAGRLLCTEALEAYNDEFQVRPQRHCNWPLTFLTKNDLLSRQARDKNYQKETQTEKTHHVCCVFLCSFKSTAQAQPRAMIACPSRTGWRCPQVRKNALFFLSSRFILFKPDICQDRLGTNIEKLNKEDVIFSQRRARSVSSRCEKPLLGKRFDIKNDSLPRQARDKHRKS
jgi:hypothetical protein